MRILVLRGGALGDFVVTLPALGLLRARWPDARIELAGNPAAAVLAVGRHYLDAGHPQSDARWARLGAGSGTLDASDPFGEWLSGFDLIINYWPDSDGAIAADFARLGFFARPAVPDLADLCDADRRARRWFIAHPAHPACAPAAAHYCAALAPLGLGTNSFAAPLHLTAADRSAAAALLPEGADRWTAWHPGSGSARKNWPRERWAEVIRRAGIRRLVVLLGESEVEARDDAPGMPAETLVLRHLPAPVLAAALQQCALFLGHDSGPAHVAAAAGCPCVLVFGPTDPAMWAPPYPRVNVLRRGEQTDAVTVDDVLAAMSGPRSPA